MISINNRRYIGNKSKLIDNILSEIDEIADLGKYSFADLFAGTGVVAYAVAKNGHAVYVNDTLYSNYVAYHAWFSSQSYNEKRILGLLENFNNLSYDSITETYFSTIYGDKYFSVNDAKKIGFIRDYIEKEKESLNEREYYILLTSLLYAADKIANTVGHFESFLKKKPIDSHFQLQMLDLTCIRQATIFNKDANQLAKEIIADVVYIDPPYNARQYVNFYHVLENLARWTKPTIFEGNSMKFKREELKSGYSRSIAPILFEELINSLNCKVIVVSYNNTYAAKSTASNNRIEEKTIIDILRKRGKVTKKEIDYKAFNSGKTNLEGHKELIFTCEVLK